MKLEFLAQGAEDCPLLRLFEYEPEEVGRLRQACRRLAAGRIEAFPLHDQFWIHPLGGCRLVWRTASKDGGVRIPAGGEPFVLSLTGEGWREIEEKLRPLEENRNGYQWLSDTGEVNVLMFCSGRW